jgi:hypothetical protein
VVTIERFNLAAVAAMPGCGEVLIGLLARCCGRESRVAGGAEQGDGIGLS